MLNVKLLSLLILVGLTVSGTAQVSFSHSLGLGFYAGGAAGAPGLVYSPRVNIISIGDELTVSVGTHLAGGLSFNSRDGGENAFMYDLPIVAELNVGHAAHAETGSSFGGFVGVGYGINRVASSSAFSVDENEAAGPLVNGGLRVPVAGNSLGLRGSFLLNTKEGFEHVYSIGLFYNFGNF